MGSSTLEPLLSIIASLLSIAGAAWAYIEADKASLSAKQATRVRDEILGRKELLEISHVYTETNRILSVSSKIGPSSNPELLVGINTVEIASQIQEYVQFINGHSSHFSDLFDNSAQELCTDLRDDIEKLAETRSPTKIKRIGKQIYYKILKFQPVAKSVSDAKFSAIKITK